MDTKIFEPRPIMLANEKALPFSEVGNISLSISHETAFVLEKRIIIKFNILHLKKNYILGPKPMENPITKVIKELITKKRRNPVDSFPQVFSSVKLAGVVIELLLNAKMGEFVSLSSAHIFFTMRPLDDEYKVIASELMLINIRVQPIVSNFLLLNLSTMKKTHPVKMH